MTLIKNKRPLSLVEILVGLAVIVAAFSTILSFSYGALKRYRFDQATIQIAYTIKDFRKKALFKDKDLQWTIVRPKSADKMFWKGAETDEVTLNFYANGIVYPEGDIIFELKEERVCVNTQA